MPSLNERYLISSFEDFIKTLKINFKLKPLSTAEAYQLNSSHIFQEESCQSLGSNGFASFFLIDTLAKHRLQIDSIRHGLKIMPNAIFIVRNENAYIDIYLKILHEDRLLTAQEIPWQENESFWALSACQSHSDLSFQIEKNFARQRLEANFIKEMRTFKIKIVKAWIGLPKEDEDSRNKLTLELMLRLLFLAFLNQKLILDGRRKFMIQEALKIENKGQSIYRHFLKPLFFSTLNLDPKARPDIALGFGNIPFLNGGLFKQSAEEERFLELDLPNELCLILLTRLFTHYQFNLDGHQKLKALDPMMLGQLFESFMPESLRKQTASYYTPMPLVREICDLAIRTWLLECGLLADEVEALFLGKLQLSKIEAAQLDAKLQNVKILDPAVGSGAFLQAAFERLLALRHYLTSLYLVKAPKPSCLAREILLNSLYGVDILESATRLCELRLWLSLVQLYERDQSWPTLPNLDLNIRCGNSLIELSQYALVLNLELPPQTHAMHARKFFGNASGQNKLELNQTILKQENENALAILNMLEKHCIEALEQHKNKKQSELFDDAPKESLKGLSKINILYHALKTLNVLKIIIKDPSFLIAVTFQKPCTKEALILSSPILLGIACIRDPNTNKNS